MSLKVFVITCDKYLWALQGFAQQFQKYWSELQTVVVAGYSEPEFDLPGNFMFHSIAPVEYDKDHWSNGLIEFLRVVPDEHFVLLLEDYWLCRAVNHPAIGTLHELCQMNPDVLRMDLTDDRQYSGHVREFNRVPYYGCNDIVQTLADSPYQMSLQAGIWNRRLMLELLNMDESAWQVEIGGSARNACARDDLIVLGTRQRPVRYANMFKGGDPGKLDLTGLLPQDVDELKATGAIPGE